MKFLKILMFGVLGILSIASCKTVQVPGPTVTQTVETGDCYENVPIYRHQYDSSNQVVVDKNGNPIEIFTGRYRKETVPCYKMDSIFTKKDINNDGTMDEIFLGMDTIWLYNRNNSSLSPSSSSIPDRVISTTITPPGGNVITQTTINPPVVVPPVLISTSPVVPYNGVRPTVGWWQTYTGWPYLYYPPFWYRVRYANRYYWWNL